MAPTLSSLRTQLLKLTEDVRRLREIFLERPPMLPGSLYTLRRRCGKPNCRCVEGHLHATEVLSYRGGPQPQNITLRPDQLHAVQQAADAYRRFRQARAELVKLHRRMIQVIDRIEAERVRQGKKKFRALLTKASRPKSPSKSQAKAQAKAKR
jgi:hypothetical protein